MKILKNLLFVIFLLIRHSQLFGQIEPIRITSSADVDTIRKNLINYIWGESGLPLNKRTPASIQYNVKGGVYEGMYDSLRNEKGNLKQINRLIMDLPNGFQSVMYHFIPEKSNGRVFIYHSGHANWGFRDEDVFNNNNGVKPGYIIPQLLKYGYSVVAVAMPLFGDPKNGNNNPTVNIPNVGEIKFTTHPQIFTYLEHPYRYFLEPLTILLNYMEDSYDYKDVFAIGLSGGAWTITAYAAIDNRIRGVFPVAGSLPLPLRINIEGGGFNDEPGFPGFYENVNYSELYTMGAFRPNGIHLQITNKYDACCFYGERSKIYENDVNTAVQTLGEGRFKVAIDTTHHKHQISRWALSKIMDEIFTNTEPFIAEVPQLNLTEDQPFEYFIKAVDLDSVFGQNVFYSVKSSPDWMKIDSVSGRLFGVPTISQEPIDSGVVVVTDSAGGTSEKRIQFNIIHVNHAPFLRTKSLISAYEDSLYHFSLWGSDPDSALFSDRVLYSLISAPSWMLIDSLSGTISGTPRGIDVGNREVIVRVRDQSGLWDIDTLSVRVYHVNHAPEIKSLSSLAAVEDSVFQSRIIATDSDSLLFGDELRYKLLNSSHWLLCDSLSGELIGTAVGYYDVMDSVLTVEVSDAQGGKSVREFILQIKHVNHPPVITSESDSLVNEDSEYRYNFSAYDADSLFGDIVSYGVVGSLPDWLSFNDTTGLLLGTARGKDVGHHELTLRAQDNSGGISEEKIKIEVIHVNHAPEVHSLPITVAYEDSLYSYLISVVDIDSLFSRIGRKLNPDILQPLLSGDRKTMKISEIKDKIEFSLPTKPSWLNINSETGWVYGIPSAKDVGDTVIALQVDDGNGGKVIQRWDLTVYHVNHAPYFTSFADSVATEDSIYVYRLSAGDQDQVLFGDVLSYEISQIPSWLFYRADQAELRGKVPIHPKSEYEIRVRVSDNAGKYADQKTVIRTRRQKVTFFDVHQNYPNPFYNGTTFKIGIPEPAYLTMEIYNVLGQKVDTPIESEMKETGYHYFSWTTNLTSGVYFYRVRITNLSNKSKTITKKLSIVR